MLFDKIKADMTTALKAGDRVRLATLRMVVSAVGYKAIDLGRELGDADVSEVIVKEVKKRKEAIASYLAAGRFAQAAAEEEEMKILVGYLPKQMGEDEVRFKVQSVKAQGGTDDFAGLMKKMMGELKGKADGAVVARIVKEMVDA